MTPATVLLVALVVVAVAFAVGWAGRLREHPPTEGALGWSVLVGAVTDFFDTLGVGSFAPTTAAFRWLGLVPDRVIPGTLNVGHALPSVAQALIFIAIVEVEPWTLAGMIGASVAGAWCGAGIVAGWDRRRVQIGMGVGVTSWAGFVGSGLTVRGLRGTATAAAG